MTNPDAPYAVVQTTRKLKVWRTPYETARNLDRQTFFGFDLLARWQWRCLICNIQGTHGKFTAAGACDAAREHYADEHD